MYNKYLEDFDRIVQTVYNSNIPKGNGTPGSIERMSSYIKDVGEKIKKINDKLTKEANNILSKASGDEKIDAKELEEEIRKIVQKRHNEWMSKHKPK